MSRNGFELNIPQASKKLFSTENTWVGGKTRVAQLCLKTLFELCMCRLQKRQSTLKTYAIIISLNDPYTVICIYIYIYIWLKGISNLCLTWILTSDPNRLSTYPSLEKFMCFEMFVLLNSRNAPANEQIYNNCVSILQFRGNQYHFNWKY